MLYSKNGSIPYPYTDGTDGWIEVPDKPEVPEGKEVVWWYPPGWVIRDPKPVDEENVKWSWSQSSEQWIKHELTIAVAVDETEAPVDITQGTSTTSATTAGTVSSVSLDSLTIDIPLE